MNYKDEKYGVKPKLKINYRENDSLILGYDFDRNTLDRYSTMKMFSNEVYKNDLRKDTHSVFALNRNKFGKFEFVEGIRYERAEYKADRNYNKYSLSTGKETSAAKLKRETHMDNVAAELVANYLYSSTGNAYAKVERGYTSPAPAELVDKINNQYVENNLKSEKYMTYELGFKDYIYNSYVGGAIFLTNTKDQIAQENLGSMNFKNYNIGKTKTYGLELEAEQYFGNLTLRESYAFTKTDIKSAQDKATEGKEIANVPRNKLNLGFTYKVTPQIKFSWDTVYSSSYYLNNQNTGGRHNSHIVTNIAVNCEVNKNLSVYAGIENLFNEKYYYAINSTGTEFDPAAERSVNAGFTYKF
jgi:iron complex outermembrane receptor protein